MVLVYFACVLLIYGVRMMVYIVFLDFAFTVLSHGSGKVLPYRIIKIILGWTLPGT